MQSPHAPMQAAVTAASSHSAVGATDAMNHIDLSPFVSAGGGDEATEAAQRQQIAVQWDSAYRTMGFAQIVGHAVPCIDLG